MKEMDDDHPDRRSRAFRITRIRPDVSRDLDEELRFHFDRTVEELMAGGMDREKARTEAERRFGDEQSYRERIEKIDRGRVAMERRSGWFGAIGSGLGGVARNFRRHPGFAAAIVATLALGLGANAAIFSIVDRLLLTPPAYVDDPGEVHRVMLERTFLGRTGLGEGLTYPDFVAMKSQPEFEWVAARSGPRRRTVGRGESAHEAQVAASSWELFPMLGVTPFRGRFFSEEEDAIGAQATAVLGYRYWESRLGSDPGVLGSSVTIDGRDYEIVGIAPDGFTGVELRQVDIWVPLTTDQYLTTGVDRWADPVQGLGWWWLQVAVRMADDASMEAAEGRASQLHRNARSERIESGRYDAEARILLTPLLADRGPERSDVSRVALWLGGVSLLVLLIACANVANLLLAREVRRRRETAVRLALGISRGRLVGEQIVESLGLALVGGGAAMLLAWWGGGILRDFLLPGVVFDSALSPRIVGFIVALSLGAGLLAGWAPAIRSGRADLQSDLKEGGRGASSSGSGIRRALTTAQAGLSAILLVGAGLFVQSLERVRSIDLGLEAEELLTVTLEVDDLGLPETAVDRPPATGTGEPDAETAALRSLYREADRRIESLPSIRSSTFTTSPLGWAYSVGMRIPGLDSLPRLPGGGPYHSFVPPDYFETLGIQVTRGRSFTAADVRGAELVAVVNESLARVGWPNQDPIGQCLVMGENEGDPCRTVVGVAENSSRGGLEEREYALYYLPMDQSASAQPAGLFVRADDPDAAAAAISRNLRGFDPRVRFVNTQTTMDFYGPQMRSWRLGASMFSLFGLLALAVAAVGLYSLLAFDVARRTRELGIRTALGAERSTLRTMVLREGSMLALAGVGGGLLVSALTAGYLGDLLFEVSPREPTVYASVALVLGAVALVASWIPALRATRVDPVEALRAE